jgi:hypothetical protein
LFAVLIYNIRLIIDSKTSVLYIFAIILSLFPVFIGYRSGFRLVRVEEYSTRDNSAYKWVLPVGVLIVFSIVFGYYSHGWTNISIGITVGLIVWIIFYRLTRSKAEGKAKSATGHQAEGKGEDGRK